MALRSATNVSWVIPTPLIAARGTQSSDTTISAIVFASGCIRRVLSTRGVLYGPLALRGVGIVAATQAGARRWRARRERRRERDPRCPPEYYTFNIVGSDWRAVSLQTQLDGLSEWNEARRGLLNKEMGPPVPPRTLCDIFLGVEDVTKRRKGGGKVSQ